MKPFSNHRAKRNTAFVVLLAWLFALATGMANACLLETPGTHSHAAAPAGHGEAIGDHDDDANPAKQACLKTCDDGSNAPVKLQTGLDLSDPGLAPLVATVWNAATPVISAPCRFDALQVPTVGPPLRVRYARLTL